VLWKERTPAAARPGEKSASVGLNVKHLIDVNDVTLAGHPSEYQKGYNVSKTLEGHGLTKLSLSKARISIRCGAVYAPL
jgi:hypothetical protein